MEEIGGREEDGADPFEELQADRPALLLFELVVEHPEEEAGALLLARPDQGAGHADEEVEVARVFRELGQPVALDGSEVRFGEVGLDGAGDRHREDGR